jgi:hypothetical protein
MSYSICRVQKIKSGGVTGIQDHDERNHSVSHTNPDIDWSKGHLNVSLIPRNEAFLTSVKKRIGKLDLKRAVRKDATVMMQALFTSDSEFFKAMDREEQLEFFEKSFDFVKDRYGEENLISATIHFDEKTPHMHVNFVPVIEGRLSAKDLFAPSDLRRLQDDYNRFVKENGYDLKRGEMQERKKNLGVAEYKLETKYRELKQKQQELEKLEEIDRRVDLDPEKGKLVYSTKEVDDLKLQNKALKVEILKKSSEIMNLKRTVDSLERQVDGSKWEVDVARSVTSKSADLEDELTFIKDFSKSNALLVQEMKPAFDLISENNDLTDRRLKAKNDYLKCNIDIQVQTDKSFALEKDIRTSKKALKDLSIIEDELILTKSELKALISEFDDSKGVFKSKERKTLTERIEKAKLKIQKLIQNLFDKFGIAPDKIAGKRKELEDSKVILEKQKVESVSRTDDLFKKRDNSKKQYKYWKTLTKTMPEPLRAIADRRDNVESNRTDSGELRITIDDRVWLKRAVEKNHPDKMDNVEEVFKLEDQQRLQEKLELEEGKINAKVIKKDFGLER